MSDIITSLIGNDYIAIITAVVALCSAISAVTPTPKEGTVLSKIYKVIDFLALNIGKAKETGKTDEKDTTKKA